MADATPGATVPPKKRFGFRKKTAPKPEAQEEERDLFSHSSTYNDIIAEQEKQKREAKRQAEEAEILKRQAEEEAAEKRRALEEAREAKRQQERERATKRRKLSSDDNVPLYSSQRGSSTRNSKNPISPARRAADPFDLGSDEDTPLKPGAGPSHAISLDDEDDEIMPGFPSIISPFSSISRQPSRESSEDPEQLDDPAIVELRKKVRARAAAEAAKKESSPFAPEFTSKPKEKPVTVQLLIISEIPDTKPLICKVNTVTPLQKPKDAWCAKQTRPDGSSLFTPDEKQNIFLTWKRQRMFESTLIKRLGIKLNDDGSITVDNDPQIYDESYEPRVCVEAWTEEVFARRQKEDALEAEQKKRAAEPEPVIPKQEPVAEPESKDIRLVMKARGKDDMKIKVRPTTNFGHLANAYKDAMKLTANQTVTLMFDGDRLSPLDKVCETDMDDMDVIEVHIK